ncbi:MAG TPA: deoxyribodipyrimidine photo-lyase, partial [Pseudoxanthomonas sp.]
MSTALVLFRQDLRLSDNAALTAACLAHERVLPVYVHAPAELAPWEPG